jgi:hypothetical protein
MVSSGPPKDDFCLWRRFCFYQFSVHFWRGDGGAYTVCTHCTAQPSFLPSLKYLPTLGYGDQGTMARATIVGLVGGNLAGSPRLWYLLTAMSIPHFGSLFI